MDADGNFILPDGTVLTRGDLNATLYGEPDADLRFSDGSQEAKLRLVREEEIHSEAAINLRNQLAKLKEIIEKRNSWKALLRTGANLDDIAAQLSRVFSKGGKKALAKQLSVIGLGIECGMAIDNICKAIEDSGSFESAHIQEFVEREQSKIEEAARPFFLEQKQLRKLIRSAKYDKEQTGVMKGQLKQLEQC